MHNPVKPTIPETRCFSIWQSIKQWWQANWSRPVISAGIDVQRDVVTVGGITMLASEYRPEDFPERVTHPMAPEEALLLLELLLHLEAAEWQKRRLEAQAKFGNSTNHAVGAANRYCAFMGAIDMVRASRELFRPGNGCSNVNARHFYEHGKFDSIAVLEYLVSKGVEIPADVLAYGEANCVD